MNYIFEYKFVPELVRTSNEEDFSIDNVEIFDDFSFVENAFDIYFPDEAEKFDWDSFHITKEIRRDVTYWLLYFPEPQKEPEAKWGIIIKKEDKPFAYFTFEKCESGNFVLGRSYKGSHYNYGIFDDNTTAEAFVEKALEIFQELKEL